MSYFARYRAGDYTNVWSELVALGGSVRSAGTSDDAAAVAREFARRSFHNAQTLYARLIDLGYKFANPSSALTRASPETAAAVEQIERELGVLPVSVKAWYAEFDSLDFSQDPAQLRAPGSGGVDGLGSHPIMLMRSPSKALEQWNHDKEEYEQSYEAENQYYLKTFGKELPRQPRPYLRSGGVASNCEPKAVHLPCASADTILYNDGGGDTYFVDEIRRAFRAGGFPFCMGYLAGRKHMPWEARPDAERVIPVLQEGLLQI